MSQRMIKHNKYINYFKDDYLVPESSKWKSDTRNGFSISNINAQTLLAKPRQGELQRNQKVNDDKTKDMCQLFQSRLSRLREL